MAVSACALRVAKMVQNGSESVQNSVMVIPVIIGDVDAHLKRILLNM